ncbi:hypothetical protein D9619_013666 [Psilocybe cf. subviscida]|uniref:Uncharacterized protein n=1 Tax=Psilocybe cf. subviscida TaxID=2480587 RepID=A0A8H5F8X2_9AGAR|nr:hypothetical protein D9619_013666 [Psilocybe cf. subviscida]
MIRALETQTVPKLAMKYTMAICSRRSVYSAFATTLVFIGVTAAFLTFGGYDTPFSPELRAKASTRVLRKVGVWIDNSQHYKMRGSTADEEWRNLAPPVNDDGEFSSVSMIHQLQCLAVIRQEYLSHSMPEMAQHCMEYIHQSILCNADTRLETVGFSKPPHVIGLPGESFLIKYTPASSPERYYQDFYAP